MPRKARLFFPGAIVHIMARGIDSRDIFIDDEDRSFFLALLESGLRKTGYRLYAWALMTNHYHLVVRTSDVPLEELMRGLNASFARYYAKKYCRKGYLFQDRYKSLVAQDQGYAEELVRYVHLNPVRAGVCKTLARLSSYPWSGHAVLLGKRDFAHQDTWTILRRFGRSVDEGRKGYLSFLEKGLVKNNEKEEIIGGAVRAAGKGLSGRLNPERWVIGDEEFVRISLEKDRERRIAVARYRALGLSLEDIARTFCSKIGIPVDALRRRTRGTKLAAVRKVFAWHCRQEYGFPVREIGSFLGISGPSVSTRIKEGVALAISKEFKKLF